MGRRGKFAGRMLLLGGLMLGSYQMADSQTLPDSSGAKTEFTETIKPIKLRSSESPLYTQKMAPILSLADDRSESGMNRIFWDDLLADKFLRGNSVEGGFFGIFPADYSRSNSIVNKYNNELGLTDRKGGFVRASEVIRLGNRTSISVSQNFVFTMPGSIVLPGRHFLAELEARALFRWNMGLVSLGIGPVAGVEIEVERETNENTPLLNPDMQEMQVNLREAGFVLKLSGKPFGKGTYIEGEFEPVWEKQLNGKMLHSRTTGGLVLTFGERFAASFFLGKGRPGGEKPYFYGNAITGVSYSYGRGSIGLRFEEERVDDPKNGKYNNRSLDVIWKQLYNDRFYSGVILGLREIKGARVIVPQFFIGLQPTGEKWRSTGSNYVPVASDLRYPYPLRIAPTNAAHLSLARRIPLFQANWLDFEFARFDPNMDAKTLGGYQNLERFRQQLDITGQILQAGGILPLGRSGFGIMLGGNYRSFVSRGGKKEDAFGIAPGILWQVGRGFAALGGTQFFRDGYGIYIGASPSWANVGFGAEFGWDDRARTLLACGEFFPSEKVAFSFIGELYRKNGFGWNKGRGKLQLGTDVYLSQGLYLNLAGLWSTNSDAAYGMESMNKYGGWLGLTNWLSGGLYVRGGIGLTEYANEPWDELRNKAQNYLTSLEWRLAMGYRFGRKLLQEQQGFGSKKSGKPFPYYKNLSNAEAHNHASLLLTRFLRANSFEYGFESAKHNWPDDLYRSQYEKFYRKWYAHDFLRWEWELNLLFNPLKNLGIGFGAHGLSGRVLNEEKRELQLVPLKLVFRPKNGSQHVKSDITAGVSLIYEGERIDLGSPSGWGIFYGMSFSKALIGGGADFGHGGRLRKFWAGAEVHPWKNGVISIYASGSPPHEQLLVMGADVRLLDAKWIEAALHGSFKLWHAEQKLDEYYPLSNEPGKLFEGLEATGKAGVTFTIGGIVYVGGEYFQTHFLSPLGPYLKGGKIFLGIKLKKSGIGGGESGSDSQDRLVPGREVQEKLAIYRESARKAEWMMSANGKKGRNSLAARPRLAL